MLKRTNPQNRSLSKRHAPPVNDGRISKTGLSREIVNISSLPRSDILNVIECLIDVIHGVKVIFTPGVEFKNALSRISFDKIE
jgi:hypothetical protein